MMSPFAIKCVRWLACIALLLVSGGCDRQDEDLDRLNEARYFINQRDYQAAISILTEMVGDDPDRGYLRLMLASAYAGDAGLNAYDAFDVIAPFLDKQVEAKANPWPAEKATAAPMTREPEAANEDEKAVKTFERLLIHHLSNFLTTFSLAFRLPHTPADRRPLLVQGIVLLGEVAPDDPDYRKSRIYRATLDLIQYINFMRDAFPGLSNLDNLNLQEFLCGIDLPTIWRNFDSLSYYLDDGVTSLQLGLRDTNSSISETVFKIQKQAHSLKTALDERSDFIRSADFIHRFLQASECP